MHRRGVVFFIMIIVWAHLAGPSSVSAQETATVTIRVLMSAAPIPVRGATVSLIQDAVTVEETTDANGEALFTVPPQGYMLVVEGRTADGFPLQLDPFYAARGGLPMFATAGASIIIMVVDDTGLVTVAAPASELRETGSQSEIPLVETPMAPVPPLEQDDVSAVNPLPTLDYPTATAAPARPTVTPRGALPAAAGPNDDSSNAFLGWLLILLGLGAGAVYWFIVRPRRLSTTTMRGSHQSEVK